LKSYYRDGEDAYLMALELLWAELVRPIVWDRIK
jgi:hypothetical protein